MDLENTTRFPARLFRTAIDDDRLAASVAARITYDIRGGALIESEEQAWPVSDAPWQSEYGILDGDQLFYRGGVDVFLFGHARPAKRDATTMRIITRVGAFTREMAVHGVRVWHKRVAGLAATAPRPIGAIPLTMSHAYGGKDLWDGLEIAYPLNAEGMGFYLNEASAVDRPLPNLEEPDQLITRWDDRPSPAGVMAYPPGAPIRLAAMHRPGEGKPLITFDARMFNAAHPRMIAPAAPPGTLVEVEGVSPDGPITFALPPLPLRARIRFDAEEAVQPLLVDQIGIEPDKQRVFLSYRFPFRYVVYPEQLRSCRLEA
ncbi:MAG: DUF2169 domain-containing protein [Byssovorax sp.]